MQAYIDTTEAEAIVSTADEQTQQRQQTAVLPVQQTAIPELEISKKVVRFISGVTKVGVTGCGN